MVDKKSLSEPDCIIGSIDDLVSEEKYKIITKLKDRYISSSYLVIPDSLAVKIGDNAIDFPINKNIPKKVIESYHPLALNICQSIGAISRSKDAQKDLPDVITGIVIQLQDITNLLSLTEEQRNVILDKILDIILNNINFTIKIAGVRIPSKVARWILAPIIKGIVLSLVDGLLKLISKKK